MSSYGYGYGYANYGYSSYGYGGDYYSIQPGGYNAYIYLTGPGSGGYYAYYSGTTKFVNSAYENYYGGKSTYAATLSLSGNFTEYAYNFSSPNRTFSEISSYISHTEPSIGSYYGYGNPQPSASYDYIEGTTYANGAYRYFDSAGFSSQYYFDGSFRTSYSDTTLTEDNGVIVPGSTHAYSVGSYTDAAGYTTYHSSQT